MDNGPLTQAENSLYRPTFKIMLSEPWKEDCTGRAITDTYKLEPKLRKFVRPWATGRLAVTFCIRQKAYVPDFLCHLLAIPFRFGAQTLAAFAH